MPAVVQDDLAADDHVVHAVRALHPPGRSRRSVVGDLVLLHPDAGEVEDHEVGRQSLPHQAAVMKAHDARRLEGQPADGVLEAQELPFPHPFTEHIAGFAGGAEVRVEVGPGVGLGGQGVAALHHLGERGFLFG